LSAEIRDFAGRGGSVLVGSENNNTGGYVSSRRCAFLKIERAIQT
jgi:hypothetical protein